MFKTVSFEDAVRLFKGWGFGVEPGPRPGEVTLIIEAADHSCCTVYDAGMLPQIATVALAVRWRNGSLVAPIGSRLRISDAMPASMTMASQEPWMLVH